MPVFNVGQTVETTDPVVTVEITNENRLAPGTHVFELVVIDEGDNESNPTQAQVVIRDTQKPTAVLSAPSEVPLGQSFRLDATRSSDVPPGRVVRFRWTLMR